MSEQSITFEKFFPRPLVFADKAHELEMISKWNDAKINWETALEAAIAEANKRIDALEGEVAELKSTVKKWQENSVDLEYRCLDKNILIAELQASNKVLREQLETALTSLKERET